MSIDKNILLINQLLSKIILMNGESLIQEDEVINSCIRVFMENGELDILESLLVNRSFHNYLEFSSFLINVFKVSFQSDLINPPSNTLFDFKSNYSKEPSSYLSFTEISTLTKSKIKIEIEKSIINTICEVKLPVIKPNKKIPIVVNFWVKNSNKIHYKLQSICPVDFVLISNSISVDKYDLVNKNEILNFHHLNNSIEMEFHLILKYINESSKHVEPQNINNKKFKFCSCLDDPVGIGDIDPDIHYKFILNNEY